jgi:hypothetical protein
MMMKYVIASPIHEYFVFLTQLIFSFFLEINRIAGNAFVPKDQMVNYNIMHQKQIHVSCAVKTKNTMG